MSDCPTQDMNIISRFMEMLKPTLPKKRKIDGFKWEPLQQKKENKNVED